MKNVVVVLASTSSDFELVEVVQIRVTEDCLHSYVRLLKHHSEARQQVGRQQPHLNWCFLGCSLFGVLAAVTTRPGVPQRHLLEPQNLISQAEMVRLQLHLR